MLNGPLAGKMPALALAFTVLPAAPGVYSDGAGGGFDVSWIVAAVIAIIAIVYIGAGILVVARPNTK